MHTSEGAATRGYEGEVRESPLVRGRTPKSEQAAQGLSELRDLLTGGVLTPRSTGICLSCRRSW